MTRREPLARGYRTRRLPLALAQRSLLVDDAQGGEAARDAQRLEIDLRVVHDVVVVVARRRRRRRRRRRGRRVSRRALLFRLRPSIRCTAPRLASVRVAPVLAVRARLPVLDERPPDELAELDAVGVDDAAGVGHGPSRRGGLGGAGEGRGGGSWPVGQGFLLERAFRANPVSEKRREKTTGIALPLGLFVTRSRHTQRHLEPCRRANLAGARPRPPHRVRASRARRPGAFPRRAMPRDFFLGFSFRRPTSTAGSTRRGPRRDATPPPTPRATPRAASRVASAGSTRRDATRRVEPAVDPDRTRGFRSAVRFFPRIHPATVFAILRLTPDISPLSLPLNPPQPPASTCAVSSSGTSARG